jgi:catechol 2,3-dioxygenase-like lactoylglutathione lyase family enzyme
MRNAISGLDHVVIAVTDLDRAEAIFRRLGFTLSPRALHSAAMGTANHTIMLAQDYFELLAVLAPTDRNGRWREALDAGEGLAGLAVATPGAAAAREAWLRAGLKPSDIVAFSRAVERPGGRRMEARFEITSLPKETLPGVSLFACAQLTRDAVWLPELMVHPNTAEAIRKVTVSLPDPVAASALWRRALPGAISMPIEGGVTLRLGNHAIDLLDPPSAAQRYRLERPIEAERMVALDFAVGNIAACRAALAQGGVPMKLNGDTTLVREEHACGVVVTMSPAGAPVV